MDHFYRNNNIFPNETLTTKEEKILSKQATLYPASFPEYANVQIKDDTFNVSILATPLDEMNRTTIFLWEKKTDEFYSNYYNLSKVASLDGILQIVMKATFMRQVLNKDSLQIWYEQNVQYEIYKPSQVTALDIVTKPLDCCLESYLDTPEPLDCCLESYLNTLQEEVAFSNIKYLSEPKINNLPLNQLNDSNDAKDSSNRRTFISLILVDLLIILSIVYIVCKKRSFLNQKLRELRDKSVYSDSGVQGNQLPFDSADHLDRSDTLSSHVSYKELMIPPGPLNVIIGTSKDTGGPATVVCVKGTNTNMCVGDVLLTLDDIDLTQKNPKDVALIISTKTDAFRRLTVARN